MKNIHKTIISVSTRAKWQKITIIDHIHLDSVNYEGGKCFWCQRIHHSSRSSGYGRKKHADTGHGGAVRNPKAHIEPTFQEKEDSF